MQKYGTVICPQNAQNPTDYISALIRGRSGFIWIVRLKRIFPKNPFFLGFQKLLYCFTMIFCNDLKLQNVAITLSNQFLLKKRLSYRLDVFKLKVNIAVDTSGVIFVNLDYYKDKTFIVCFYQNGLVSVNPSFPLVGYLKNSTTII